MALFRSVIYKIRKTNFFIQRIQFLPSPYHFLNYLLNIKEEYSDMMGEKLIFLPITLLSLKVTFFVTEDVNIFTNTILT